MIVSQLLIYASELKFCRWKKITHLVEDSLLLLNHKEKGDNTFFIKLKQRHLAESLVDKVDIFPIKSRKVTERIEKDSRWKMNRSWYCESNFQRIMEKDVKRKSASQTLGEVQIENWFLGLIYNNDWSTLLGPIAMQVFGLFMKIMNLQDRRMLWGNITGNKNIDSIQIRWSYQGKRT